MSDVKVGDFVEVHEGMYGNMSGEKGTFIAEFKHNNQDWVVVAFAYMNDKDGGEMFIFERNMLRKVEG